MQWNRQDNSNYSQQPQQRTQGQNYNASQIQQGGIFQTGTQPQSFSGRQPSSQSTPFGTTGFAQTSSAYSPPPSQAFSQSTSSSAFGQQSSGSSFGQSNQPTVNPLQSVLSALQAAQATTSTQQRTQPNIGTQQSSQSVGSSVLNPSVLQQLQQLQAVLGQSQPQQQTPAPSQTQVSTQQTQGMPIQLLSQLQQLQQHLLSSGQQGQNQPNFQQASNIQNAQLLQQQLQQQQVQQLQQLQRLQSQQQQQQLSQAPQQKAPQSQQGFGNVGDQWRQQSSQQMGFGQQPRPSFGQQQNAQNYGQKQNYQQSGRSGMQDRRDSGRDANKGVGDRGGPRRDFNRRSPSRKPENKDRRSPPRRRSPVRESRTSAPVKREETRPKRRSKSPTKDKKETKDVKSTPEKKREKSPDEERKDKRRDVFHYSEYERDYYNIKRRYPKLYVSEDFARLISSWVNNCPLNSKFPIFEYNPIHVDNIKSDKIYSDPPFNSDSMSGEIVYNAKVMLTTGLPTELSSSKPISSQIKFLVAKHDRSALMCIGGPWSASIDGGDPANDDSALIRTAIRWTKEWTDIDLTYCEHWIHFMEIHYHRPQESSRPTHTEITVIFLPIFHNLIPGHDEFVQKYVEQQLAKHASEKSDKKEKHKEEEKTTESPTPITETPAVVVEPLSEEQKKKEEEDKVEKEKKLRERYRDDAPRHAGLLATFQKPECILISLDGLLEYNESDKLEKTFEVSLFAENFYEMLSRDFGSSIFETLLSQSYSKGKKRLRDNEGEERDSKKRTTEESTEKKDEEMKQETESPESKLIDLNSEAEVKLESTESTKPTEIVTESIPPLEAEGKSDMQTEEGIKLEETPQVKPEEAPSTPTNVVTSPSEQKPKEEKKRKTIVDNELLIAFQFFDRDNNGYLKESRVRQLIHSLGYYYSPYYVDTLVEKFAESKRIYYKKFTEKELHE